jgi:hypothetical protein
MTRRESIRYLSVALGVAAALAALAAVAAYAGVAGGALSPDQTALVNQRLGKIAAMRADAPPDVVFVGDSSLGYAISEDAFETATGLSAANLALTGLFGYAGPLNMIRRVRAEVPATRFVVMHSVDMLTREPTRLGGPLTDPAPGLAERLAMLRGGFTVANIGLILRNAALGGRVPAFVADYVPQGGGPFRETAASAAPGRVNPAKLDELRALGAHCAREGLLCVYAHGPFWDEACALGAAFFADAAREIEAAGFVLAPGTPLCLSRAELGNTPDHVRPDLTPAVTARYAAILAPLLAVRTSGRSAP